MGLVAHVGVALRGGVELFLEHPLVDGADRELGAAEDFCLDPPGVAKGVVGDDPAGPAADLLRPEGPFLEVVPLAPLPGAVGVVDRHPDHGDRRVDAGNRPHAGDAAAGAHDHPAVDLLAQDRVGAADVAGTLGGDGRGLDAKPELAERGRGVEHALVTGLPPLLQREVEVPGFDLDPQHDRVEEAERLPEQLHAGLVAVEDGDRRARHRPNDMARSVEGRGHPGHSAATCDFPEKSVFRRLEGGTFPENRVFRRRAGRRRQFCGP